MDSGLTLESSGRLNLNNTGVPTQTNGQNLWGRAQVTTVLKTIRYPREDPLEEEMATHTSTPA